MSHDDAFDTRYGVLNETKETGECSIFLFCRYGSDVCLLFECLLLFYAF